MAILKCKMCGGDLNFEEGATVVDCEYCGTKQTVPTIDDEKKITLFARANRLRFACEFDKASGIYESIVADFSEEAEAYWGLVLCKYGIEYVDDPATGKKIPTCHRSSFESVLEDDNFEQVLENADPIARSVYREEAKQIEELRRGIIEVSNKEEPYDIFICYKETAENGERTIDSVIAQDVYDELTAKGYRVFFSRITLEDRLGKEYEPYIFAALNSAKIMLAFGTDYEYYNAVWVKNEWSRFLQLIAKGEKKTLIPCYKNIDAYDMPKEFAKLQAQDMGKVGAIQDLLRGIEKLLPRKESAQPGKETGTVVQQQAQSATIDSLLKRAFMYLEDGDWSNAAEYCNRVLDISPENAEAYVGLLMAELQVKKEDELARQNRNFGQDKHFIKAVRFSGEERRRVLEGYEKAAENYLEELQEKRRRQQQEEEKRRLEEKKRQKMDQALAQISELWEKHGNLAQFQKLTAFWANPDNKKENCLVDNREPRTIGERYLYLAEHFQISDRSEWIEVTFELYRCALQHGADREKSIVSKQKFCEAVLKTVQNTQQLKVLEREFPEDWRVYWKYFELIHEEPTNIQTCEQEAETFLAQCFAFEQSGRQVKKGQELVQSLHTAIEEYSVFPQKRKEKLQVYLEKAFACAGNHLPALQKEWEEYFQKLQEQCGSDRARLVECLNRVQEKIEDENRRHKELDEAYRRNAFKKGNFRAAMALFLLMIAGYTAYRAWQTTCKPEILLPYSTFWYAVAAVLVCVAETALFCIIQIRLVQKDNPKYPYGKLAGILLKCSIPLTALTSLAALVLFVSGASEFKDNMGTISIGTPEEISYIKKHPDAVFIITQDIDLSDTEWKAVSNFSGTLDGQGHCLKGIVSKAPYLFSTNTGTVENIVFAEIGISADRFSLVDQNNGTIEACEIRNVRLGKGEFWGFSKLNKGTVQNCVLTDIIGNTENFAGIAQKNEEEGIIKDCMVSELKMGVLQSFAGVVTDNKGMISNIEISDCTVSGCVEIAGICRDNNNTVKSCHVEKLTAEDVTLSLGGGLIANSKGDVNDCAVFGLELSGRITGTMGGLIANSNGNVKDCTVIGMKLSVEADGVIGGLIASSEGSVKNCSVTGLELSGEIDGVMGGLIGQSAGDVISCGVEGIISLEGRSKIAEQAAPWLICGGLVGEQIRGNVESSSSVVQIHVDYYNPTYRGIFAGGLAGGINGGCSILNSFFDGNIEVTVTEEEKAVSWLDSTTSDTYKSTEDFIIGGLFGKYRIGEETVSVEDSYSSGKISVQIMKEVALWDSLYIFLGGFTGSNEKRLNILNSYSNLQIESSVPPENMSDAMHIFIRNRIGGFTPNSGGDGATIVSATNCFFAGKLKYANLVGDRNCCGMWGGVKSNNIMNCYYSANCGYGNEGISGNLFCSSTFYRDTLGWNPEIWNLEDGALPTLKNTGPMVKTE